MNKKTQKGLVSALAAVMSAGIAAPVIASAATTDLGAQYKAAYDAVQAALKSNTQKDLTAARVLVDALYVDVKGTPDEYLATTLSSLLDPAQQVKLVELFAAIDKADASVKQADINAARTLILDMPQVWVNSFSSRIDTIQQKMIDKVVAAIAKAEKSGLQADVDAANALVAELATVTNNDGVKATATTLKARLDKVVVIPTVQSVTAIDTNKIQVVFSSAVDTTKVTVALKQGLATQYTTATFAADNKSVTLTAPIAIAAGDYNVVVSGLSDSDVVTPISIVAATPKAVAVTNTQVSQDANAVVSFSVTNQYGTDMGIFGNDPDLSVQAYDVTANTAVAIASTSATKSEVALNLATAKIGDDVRIIVNYKGLTVTKTVKVVAVAAMSDVTLGTVSPLKDTPRITAGDAGLVLPYTLKDQYGADVKLATATAGTVGTVNTAITFLSSDKTIVDPATFAVDANGQLTFTAGANAGTATITAIINATGKVATTTVTVSAKSALKSVAIASPTALLAVGETAALKLTGVDQYGAATKDFSAITKVNTTNANITGSIINGVLNVSATAAGTATLTLTDGAATPTVYGTVTVKYEAAAVPTAIVGLGTPSTFEVGAVQNVKLSDIKVKDQYGRDFALTNKSQVTVAKVTSTDTAVAIADVDTTTYSLTAANAAGTEAIKYTLTNGASYTVNYNVVPTANVVSYAVTGAKTIYAQATPAAAYDLALGVEGRLADGTKVVLAGGKITNATSSNLAVATVSSTGVVTGLTKGTTTVALWNGATKLAETTITVDSATPVQTTVSIDDSTPFTVAVAGTVDVSAKLTVLDQYGVALAKTGFWATSDSSIATVNASTGVVTGVKAGQVTITYVTPNGIVKTTTVTVQ